MKETWSFDEEELHDFRKQMRNSNELRERNIRIWEIHEKEKKYED